MVIKTYTTETPLNSAALAPSRPYVYLSLLKRSDLEETDFLLTGLARRRTGSHECNDDISAPRKIRDAVLAQGFRRGSWTSEGPFRADQYVRGVPSIHPSHISHHYLSHSIAVHPSGTSYASGGEDGFIRVHHFDDSYFKAKPYGDMEIAD